MAWVQLFLSRADVLRQKVIEVLKETVRDLERQEGEEIMGALMKWGNQDAGSEVRKV